MNVKRQQGTVKDTIPPSPKKILVQKAIVSDHDCTETPTTNQTLTISGNVTTSHVQEDAETENNTSTFLNPRQTLLHQHQPINNCNTSNNSSIPINITAPSQQFTHDTITTSSFFNRNNDMLNINFKPQLVPTADSAQNSHIASDHTMTNYNQSNAQPHKYLHTSNRNVSNSAGSCGNTTTSAVKDMYQTLRNSYGFDLEKFRSANNNMKNSSFDNININNTDNPNTNVNDSSIDVNSHTANNSAYFNEYENKMEPIDISLNPRTLQQLNMNISMTYANQTQTQNRNGSYDYNNDNEEKHRNRDINLHDKTNGIDGIADFGLMEDTTSISVSMPGQIQTDIFKQERQKENVSSYGNIGDRLKTVDFNKNTASKNFIIDKEDEDLMNEILSLDL